MLSLTSTLSAKVTPLDTTVEEQRIIKAEGHFSTVVNRLDDLSHQFKNDWRTAKTYEQLKAQAYSLGNKLWKDAKISIQSRGDFDDRSLYWQRLKITRIIRTDKASVNLSSQQREALLHLFEQSSRGANDLEFIKNTDKKILLTGFDPFLLDRNIDQSNPSGVIAMMLDGMVIEHNGVTAEINTFMAPVRYSDFDQGMVETVLSPFYLNNNVDLITTVSMGRKNFDLERFPGKRRSASAPDNNNLYSGGDKTSPVIPKLGEHSLPGNEFVEFSLPVKSMQKSKGSFAVNDNHQVTTLTKSFKPVTFAELENEVAVSGSGGGYLSNEISYRSIRLRNQLNSSIPTGHIHTPRISHYDRETTESIANQVVDMLKKSLTDI
ncbi:hypothetical protein [Endozoicomonas arenosclerae]|uniref:hypothetical protein n=1 Tax=Endozoicomonas arenosclerae TaxID=1633495 RepID=UPI000B16A463|nr:hypothetical protein [Endozoicomonas arenosclerae]